MALLDFYVGKVSLGMSNRKTSTHRLKLRPAEANLYIAEITQTLKDATNVGQYFLKVQDLSAGTLIAKGVELRTEDDAPDYPSADAKVWAFDKINVSYHAGFKNYTTTIPGRKNSAFTMADDGITINTTNSPAAAVSGYMTYFNLVALGDNNVNAALDRMWINK